MTIRFRNFLTSGFAWLCVLLCAVPSFGGTVTGVVQSPAGGPLKNATFTFQLTQAATVSGTALIAPVTVSCYTDGNGNVVGEPNPLAAPVLTTNTSSGTLASGTYYVVLAYFDGTGTTIASPETSINLSSTGTLVVNAPGTQPAGASGYQVFIGTAPGAETLQGTVTGTPGQWGSFQQASALAAGAALPSSNTTQCKLRFNDELQPSFVCYDVGLTMQSKVTVPGYPQYWYLFGGSNGVINVGSGTPQSSVCQGAGVFYPQAIVAMPQNGESQTIGGNLLIGGTVTAAAVNNVIKADQYASLTAAVAALGGQGAIELPCGPNGTQKTYTISSTIPITSDGVKIFGHGLCSNLSITTASDVFQVTGALFQLRDLNVTIGTSTSRNGSAIVHPTNSSGSQGSIENVRFVGNASSPDNGMILYEDQPDTGLWIGRTWRIVGGVAWQAFVKLKSAGPDTIASNYFYTLAGSAGCTEACISLDGAIDTVLMFGLDLEPNITGSGPDLWLKNTPSATISPRGVICTGCALSNSSASSTGPTVQLDNSRHFQYIGGEISGPSDGIDVNTNAIETIIDGAQIFNVGQYGIKDTSTTAGFSHYDHNTFVDVCGAANNTYDAIQIGNSVFDRTAIGNSVRLFANSNKCAHGINIVGPSGSGISVIANDIITAAVTTKITDGDTTGNNTILANPGASNSIAANNTSMNAGLNVAGTGVGTGTTVYPLELSGTSSSTGGLQVFTGQLAVNANERFRVEPSDGTVRASSFQINALAGGLLTGTTNASISSSGVVKGTAYNATNLLISATAPTISSGFGTSPSVATNNGTAAFTVNVGTGGTATSGVIGLPAATNGWNCTCEDMTTFSTTVFRCRQTASSTTSATIGNFNTSATAAAWVANDLVSVSCFAR